MNTSDFKQPTGSFIVKANISMDTDFISCNYSIHKDGDEVSLVAGYKGLVKYLMSFGVDEAEINMAVLEMSENDHDTAIFGVYGSFMFTKDSLDLETKGVA